MNTEPLLYWIRERESIRRRRAAGEPEVYRVVGGV
jgi:hypothetical protein